MLDWRAWAAAAAAIAASSCAAPSEERDIVYDARFGEDTSLDVYLPDDSPFEKDGRRPAVLFVHGGAWRSGSKAHGEGLGRRLARSGYVTVSINYRLLPAGVFPRNAQDCICSLAWVRANADRYRIDPDRIVVMGYSAGSHLASLVGVASNHPELAPDCDVAVGRPVARPAAVIAASGPQDLRQAWDGVEDLLGGPPSAIPHAYDLASPIHHVKPGAPPYLIVTDLSANGGGNSDMRDRLAAVGADVRLLKIAGSLHVLEQGTDPGVIEVGVATDTPEAWIAIDDFLRRRVGGR